jgi:hypothetical protein
MVTGLVGKIDVIEDFYLLYVNIGDSAPLFVLNCAHRAKIHTGQAKRTLVMINFG